MTSQEARRHTCKPGYWLVNVAVLGDPPNWVEQLKPHDPLEGKLFGYETGAFLRKQYKA